MGCLLGLCASALVCFTVVDVERVCEQLYLCRNHVSLLDLGLCSGIAPSNETPPRVSPLLVVAKVLHGHVWRREQRCKCGFVLYTPTSRASAARAAAAAIATRVGVRGIQQPAAVRGAL